MMVVMNATDMAPNRVLQNNYRAIMNTLMSQTPPIVKTEDFKNIEDILAREGSLGTIDRSTSASMMINRVLEDGMSGAKSEAIEANDGGVVNALLFANHYFDRRGRVAAFMFGEQTAEGGIQKALAKDNPLDAFKAFQDHVGYGKLADGEWNQVYHLLREGKHEELKTFMGVHMSRAMLFNYFPGAGAGISKHPLSRSMIPFYSYLSQRGHLLFRAMSRTSLQWKVMPRRPPRIGKGIWMIFWCLALGCFATIICVRTWRPRSLPHCGMRLSVRIAEHCRRQTQHL